MNQREIRELETFFLRERRGSFTPTYFGLTTAGTTTYSIQDGRYVLHGSVCEVFGRVAWTAATGTGQAAIGGLPFTVPAVGTLHYPVTFWTNGVTFAGGDVTGFATQATTRIALYSSASNTVVAVDVEAAGDLMFNVRYLLG